MLQDLLLIRDRLGISRIKTFHLLDPIRDEIICSNGETLMKALRALRDGIQAPDELEVWLGLGFDATDTRYQKEVA
jgi:hypothetical protein